MKNDAIEDEEVDPYAGSYGDELYRLSQDGHVLYFVERYGAIVRWDHSRQHFYVFKDHCWVEDRGGYVPYLISDSIRQRVPELAKSRATEPLIKALGSANAQAGIFRLLKKDPTVGRSRIDWNPNPLVLGAPNGVIDLRTGELRDGRPSDLINLQVACDYQPKLLKRAMKERGEWLLRLMRGDEEMARYVRLLTGYSATGLAHEQLWVFAHGRGQNGKSLYIGKMLLSVMGSYGLSVMPRLVMKGRGGNKGELLTLEGKRVGLLSEAAQEMDPDFIKKLASVEMLGDVQLYTTTQTQFDPTLKLWIDANDKPAARDTSFGFWRRVRLLPFEETFDLDPDFEESIKAGLLLNLAFVVGCAMEYLEFAEAGGNLELKKAPEAVRSGVKAYQDANDPVGAFVGARLESREGAKVRNGVMYQAYRDWMVGEGHNPQRIIGPGRFKDELERRFPGSQKTIDGASYWKGVGFRGQSANSGSAT